MRANTQPQQRRNVLVALGWQSAALHRGIARYAREAGWMLDLSLVRYAHRPYLKRIDGVIGLPRSPNPMTDAILAAGIPAVSLHRSRHRRGVAFVLQDNVGIGRATAGHMLAREFKHFVFYALNLHEQAAAERLAGFRGPLRRRGMDCTVLLVDRRPRRARPPVVTWLVEQLRRVPRPFAVFAFNDDMALDVLLACDLAGFAVPEEVAIVGADNDEMARELARVPLSSVDSNMEEQAYAAARLLDRLMHGARPPARPQRVPHKGLVGRKSSDMLAVQHRTVAAAIRVIRDGYSNANLDVAGVADTVGMSRRGLDKAFLAQLSRTVSQELRRVRLEKALELLNGTNLRITAIARQCGFSRLGHLREVMERELGVTPSAWRRQWKQHKR